MTAPEALLGAIADTIAEHRIHTVEVGAVDTYGHLRGKRVPAGRFVSSVAVDGINIADAIYVFDVQCEIVDSPIINMGTGFLDMHLTPDLTSFRVLTHRPGYAIVLADSFDEHGHGHALDRAACWRVRSSGVLGRVSIPSSPPSSSATSALPIGSRSSSMCSTARSPTRSTSNPWWRPCVLRCSGAGIPLESSNPEYGPGQLEINFGPADPITTADNTVLFTSIVKQVAVQHGCRATFMPKPLTGQSGSGMHIHSSLNIDGVNQFGAHADGQPNATMGHWTAGLLEHAPAMSLIGIPLPNGYRRVRPYTFAPTHVHWGSDNRTVLARLTTNAGSANRIEFRSAGADANPYLAVAAVLAAGCDGLERQLALPPMAVGDMYTEPGQCAKLPATFAEGIAAYSDSALATALGAEFSENFVVLAEYEQALAAEAMAGDPDVVTEWERARYLEHI